MMGAVQRSRNAAARLLGLSGAMLASSRGMSRASCACSTRGGANMGRFNGAFLGVVVALSASAFLACGDGANGTAGVASDAGAAPGEAVADSAAPLPDGAAPAAGEYWPAAGSDAWETVTPEAAGWDRVKLDAALAYAESKASTAMIVLVDGRIVAERYWQGWNAHSHEQIYSAAKSITSILVGIAQEKGLLNVADLVTKHLGVGWSKAPVATEATITIDHLLTMSSGLDDELVPVGQPGQKWYYSTGAYLKLGDILEKVSGDRDVFTRDNLFAKIGAQDSAWMPGGPGKLGQTISASARDMARFGLTMLRNGRCSTGDVIADKAYVASATSTSQPLNPAYGRLFWLNGKASFVEPVDTAGSGPLIPAAPIDLVAALGKGDKKIYVVPSRKWVVVRHGESAGPRASLASSTFDNELWQKLMDAAPADKL
jgi:CubicO group peptidase (beta-lactamase class C family)